MIRYVIKRLSCFLFLTLIVCWCSNVSYAEMGGYKRWAISTHKALEIIANRQSPIPVSLTHHMDTELSGPVLVQVSRPVMADDVILIPPGSRVICRYKKIRNAKRVQAYCDRILHSNGFDFEVEGTLYGNDGLLGIPADALKSNGSLLVDSAKILILRIDHVKAVGLLGQPKISKN